MGVDDVEMGRMHEPEGKGGWFLAHPASHRSKVVQVYIHYVSHAPSHRGCLACWWGRVQDDCGASSEMNKY